MIERCIYTYHAVDEKFVSSSIGTRANHRETKRILVSPLILFGEYTFVREYHRRSSFLFLPRSVKLEQPQSIRGIVQVIIEILVLERDYRRMGFANCGCSDTDNSK
mmetsp:Transcript_10883/g.20243  ORF Transcript_10883/g.20243 Transcript_10883/m.20243 type:complete len:106 (-) Transcript_10883:309-626(-)